MTFFKTNFIFLLFLFPIVGLAQAPNTKRIENFKKRITEATTFEKKIEYISNLSAYYAYDLGDTISAQVEAKRCIDLSQAANYPSGIAAGLHDYGIVQWFIGNTEKARFYFDSCYTFCERNKVYPTYYYSNCMNLADYHFAVGDYKASEKFTKIAITTSDTAAYNLKLSAYYLLSSFAIQKNQDAEAYNYLMQGILLNRKHNLKDPQFALCLYEFLSKRGAYEKANEYIFEAEKLVQQSNDPTFIMGMEEYKGDFQSLLKNHEQALKHFKQALMVAKENNLGLYFARIKNSIGRQLNKLGRNEEALSSFKEALGHSLKNNQQDATQSYIGIAESQLSLRQYEKAYQNINKGQECINVLDTVSRASFIFIKAKIDAANQKNAIAIEGFKNALQQFQNQQINDNVVEVANELSNYFQKIGATKEADFYFSVAKNYQDSLLSKRSAIARIMFEENEKLQKTEVENNFNTTLTTKTAQRNGWIGLSIALFLALSGLGIWQFRKRKALKTRYQETVQTYQTTIENYDKILATLNYNIAHDLRRPLINAEMSIQNLKKDIRKQSNEYIETNIKSLDENLKNMQGLIAAMLKLAQIENHSIDDEEVDLNEVIDAVIANNQHQIKAQNIALNVGILPKISADPYLMFQVFDNLLANAIKFSKLNELNTIEISGSSDTDHTVILVKDNGVGFDNKQKDYIFEPFKQLKNATQTEGFGIGLSIVKNIIDKYQGQIQAISSINNGTTFYIRIPCV